MTITWHIKPLSTPSVLRNCSHCGGLAAFISSNKFRINAQQKNLDVWLIYQCEKCNCSWNMPILSRVKPEDIGFDLYDGFLDNSADLALKYAFDAELHRRNNMRVCFDDVAYDVEGDCFSLEQLRKEDIVLHIRSPYNLHLRLDKLLREKLRITRRALENAFQCGDVTSNDFGFRPEKSTIILKADMTLYFKQAAAGLLVII